MNNNTLSEINKVATKYGVIFTNKIPERFKDTFDQVIDCNGQDFTSAIEQISEKYGYPYRNHEIIDILSRDYQSEAQDIGSVLILLNNPSPSKFHDRAQDLSALYYGILRWNREWSKSRFANKRNRITCCVVLCNEAVFGEISDELKNFKNSEIYLNMLRTFNATELVVPVYFDSNKNKSSNYK